MTIIVDKENSETHLSSDPFSTEIIVAAQTYGLISDASLILYEEGSILSSNNNMVYLFERGNVGIVRSLQNQKILAISYISPTVLGCGNMFCKNITISFTYQFISRGRVHHIPADNFYHFVNDMKLWKVMAQIFAIYHLRMHQNYRKTNNSNSYQTIKKIINEYSTFPKKVKKEINIANYILGSSTISRSNVMKILSMLKRHGFITLNRGELLTVHQLPEQLW